MGEPSRPCRILVVDDHDFMRGAIKAVLEKEPSLEVVGEAEDGLEALAKCREASPDLVLMDLSMPNMGGMEATRRMKKHCPKAVVLVLTAHACRRAVQRSRGQRLGHRSRHDHIL